VVRINSFVDFEVDFKALKIILITINNHYPPKPSVPYVSTTEMLIA